MDALNFAFEDPETVCAFPLTDFLDVLKQLTLCSSHLFGSGCDTEVINIKVIINSRIKTLRNTVNLYIELCH